MNTGKVYGTKLRYHGNILLAGLSASGKTTHSYMLAGAFGLTYVSGSQTHLAINGLSPVQSRGFWIEAKAQALLTRPQFRRVEKELGDIESENCGCIFDSWIMPWLKSKPGLNIYLMSTLESRVLKAAVSRRDDNFAIDTAFREAIRLKDQSAIRLYRETYGVDIEKDLAVFDLIVDISRFISSPTFAASRRSILSAHPIIESAVGYYLTGQSCYKRELKKHQHRDCIIKNTLLD